MTNVPRVLGKSFGIRPTRGQVIGFACALPALAVLSYFFVGTASGAIPEHPGGDWLEIAFWLTAIATAFLSYLMMELLFRSREVKLLAPWPVHARDILNYQLRRVFSWIAITTIPWVFFWAPQLFCEPSIALLCISLWPAGLCVCAALALAVLVYTGDMATEKQGQAGFGIMAFSMAPAIALGGSLITTLLLKLLAEALLKPGFIDAALTAAGITAGAFAVAMFYASRVYKKRYYRILACFMDNDRIVLNAEYDFVGDATYQAISRAGAHSKTRALSCAWVAQCRRKFTLSSILVIVCELVLAASYLHSPESLGMTALRPGCFAILPVIVFSHPWLSVSRLAPEQLRCLPLREDEALRARLSACIRLVTVPSVLAGLAVAVPTASAHGLGAGMLQGVAVMAALFLITALLGYHAVPGRRSVLFTGACALFFAIVAIL